MGLFSSWLRRWGWAQNGSGFRRWSGGDLAPAFAQTTLGAKYLQDTGGVAAPQQGSILAIIDVTAADVTRAPIFVSLDSVNKRGMTFRIDPTGATDVVQGLLYADNQTSTTQATLTQDVVGQGALFIWMRWNLTSLDVGIGTTGGTPTSLTGSNGAETDAPTTTAYMFTNQVSGGRNLAGTMQLRVLSRRISDAERTTLAAAMDLSSLDSDGSLLFAPVPNLPAGSDVSTVTDLAGNYSFVSAGSGNEVKAAALPS